jgi:hypothetical protein
MSQEMKNWRQKEGKIANKTDKRDRKREIAQLNKNSKKRIDKKE